MLDFLTCGQLARFVGRSRETIRRYEALGLIPPGHRDPVNRRRYWTPAEAESIRELLRPLATAPGSVPGAHARCGPSLAAGICPAQAEQRPAEAHDGPRG